MASDSNKDMDSVLNDLGRMLGELNTFDEKKPGVPVQVPITAPLDLESLIADLDQFKYASEDKSSTSIPLDDTDEDVFSQSELSNNHRKPLVTSEQMPAGYQLKQTDEDIERSSQLQELSERLNQPLAEELPGGCGPRRYPASSLSGSSGYSSNSSISSPSCRGSSSSSSLPSPLSPHDVSWPAGRFQKLSSSESSQKSSDQNTIKVYLEDGTHVDLEIDQDVSARQACYRLQIMNHYLNSLYWTLVEQYPDRGLERSLEDHESVSSVCSSWPPDVHVRFLFKTTRKKYDFFENTENYFPPHLLDSDSSEKNISEQAQKAKRIIIQDMLSTCSKVPEIEGYLNVKDFHKKSWSKRFFVLRTSGLYYSTKGMSKASKDLQACIHFSNVNVYFITEGHKPPTEYCFCIMPIGTRNGKDGRCFSAEDSKTMLSWVVGIRIAKYGEQLRKNYDDSWRKQAKLSHMYKRSLSASEGKTNTTENNMSRRKTSGHDYRSTTQQSNEISQKSRSLSVDTGVLKSQAEKLMSSQAAQLESKPPALPPKQVPGHKPAFPPAAQADLATAHVLRSLQDQEWYHGDIPRQIAFKLLMANGMEDGLFLVRDSLSLPGEVILTFCMDKLIYHCQIVKETDSDGKLQFHLENGPNFWTVQSLIQHYKDNYLDGTSLALRTHCPKRK